MKQQAFIDSVDELYAMRDRVAKNAKRIIEDMLREAGDMSEEYLYGEEDDYPNRLWLGDNKELCGIAKNDEEEIIVEIIDNDEGYYTELLDRLDSENIIDIADFLCRM